MSTCKRERTVRPTVVSIDKHSSQTAAHGAVAVGLPVGPCFIHFFEVEQDVIFPVGLFESFLVLPHAGAVFSRQLDGEIIDEAGKGAEAAEDGNMF